MIEDLKHIRDVLNRYIGKYERQEVFGQNTEELDLKEIKTVINRFVVKYENQNKETDKIKNFEDFKQRGMWQGKDYY